MNADATIHTMRDIAKNERDLARAATAQAESAAERARVQSEQLQQYRADYAQRWNAQFRNASAIELVRCYQVFMHKLDQAIAHQQRQAQDAADRAEAARAKLRHRELNLASVGKLLERRLHARTKSAARDDQQASDEAAQRAAFYRTRPFANAI